MNRLQRILLVCGLVGLVCLCLCPPWDYYVTIQVPVSDAEMNRLRAAFPSERINGRGYTETSQQRRGHVWVFGPPDVERYRSLTWEEATGQYRGLQSVPYGPRLGIAFSRLGLEAGTVVGMTAIAVVLAGWRKPAKPN